MFNSAVKDQPFECCLFPRYLLNSVFSVLWGTPSLCFPQGPPAWEVKPRQVNSTDSTDLPVGFGAFSFPFFDVFAQSSFQLPRHEASFTTCTSLSQESITSLHIPVSGEALASPAGSSRYQGTQINRILPSGFIKIPINQKSSSLLFFFFSIVKCQILTKCSQ